MTAAPTRAARLLLTERDALLPILRRTPAEKFDLPTICTGWSVRDVLAHCSAALTMTASGSSHRFTPEDNQADVEERRGWPLEEVLAELERGYGAAADAVARAGGAYDGVAIGEWIHGGDVRGPLGEPNPYCSEGLDDALELLAERSRQPQRAVPYTHVTLPGHELFLGTDTGAAPAQLTTDPETLVRLLSGRKPDMSRVQLTGASPDAYVLFS